MSKAYYNVLAELDYELFSPFETEPDFESEIESSIDDLTPHATPIDYLIGVEPKYEQLSATPKQNRLVRRGRVASAADLQRRILHY